MAGERYPRSWQLQASNDNNVWTDIGALQVPQSPWVSGQETEVVVDHPVQFSSYRILLPYHANVPIRNIRYVRFYTFDESARRLSASSESHQQQWFSVGDDALVAPGGSDAPGPVAVALAADGQTLALGRPGPQGHVRVYDRAGGNGVAATWAQRGGDVVASPLGNASVALSADGSTVAVGDIVVATGNAAARVFEWSGGAWAQIGDAVEYAPPASLPSETAHLPGGDLGVRVALSDDGQTLAVGAFGQARVYAAPAGVPMATAWTLLGAAIASGERGVPVALSADGTVLATGAYDVASANEGVAQVRAWDAISNTWQPVWTNADANAGARVALSADGHALALGGIWLHCADYRIGPSDRPDAKIGIPAVRLGYLQPSFAVELGREGVRLAQVLHHVSDRRRFLVIGPTQP